MPFMNIVCFQDTCSQSLFILDSTVTSKGSILAVLSLLSSVGTACLMLLGATCMATRRCLFIFAVRRDARHRRVEPGLGAWCSMPFWSGTARVQDERPSLVVYRTCMLTAHGGLHAPFHGVETGDVLYIYSRSSTGAEGGPEHR